MIGYDPRGLMIHMAHKQNVLDALEGEPGPATEARLKAHAEEVVFEKTGIKSGVMATVCLSAGISLVGAMRPAHDHDDPQQHTVVWVTDIDHWGNIHYITDDGEEEDSTHMGMIVLCGQQA